MSFLATLNNFFLANEMTVVTVVAAALVLFQLALVISAFLADSDETASDEETDGQSVDDLDVWSAYVYAPWGF